MINRTAQVCITVNVIGITLITTAVALRMYAQRLIPLSLQVDDCLILVAMVRPKEGILL